MSFIQEPRVRIATEFIYAPQRDYTDAHVATVICIINRTVAVQEARSSGLEYIYHGCMVSILWASESESDLPSWCIE